MASDVTLGERWGGAESRWLGLRDERKSWGARWHRRLPRGRKAPQGVWNEEVADWP